MKHIKKIKSYSMVGSLGLTVTALLQGCGEGAQDTTMPAPQQGNNMETLQGDLQEQNYFLVIEQTAANPDKYQLAEKHPTEGATRAVLKGLDGTETILSNDELKALAEAEAAKVDAGTSNLTQPAEASSGGMSLGEMVLASAAGALIGGMLANKLSNNQNYRDNQRANTRPGAQVSQPGKQRSAPTAKQKSTPKSGFGGQQGSSSSSSARSFGG